MALTKFTISYETKQLPVTVTIPCHPCRTEANPKLEQPSKTNFLGPIYSEGKLLLGFIHSTKNNPIKTSASIENSNKALLQKHFKLYYIIDFVFKKAKEHYFPSLSSFISFGS